MQIATYDINWTRDLTDPEAPALKIGKIQVEVEMPDGLDPLSHKILTDLPLSIGLHLRNVYGAKSNVSVALVGQKFNV